MAMHFAKFSSMIVFTTFFLGSTQSNSIIDQNVQFNDSRLREIMHQSHQNNTEEKDNKWFVYPQTLDHFNFNPQSYIKFPQRYVLNARYWGGVNTTSPIFVVAGDTDSLEKLILADYVFNNLASHFQALLLFIEHRYYGDSFPFGSEIEAYKNSTTRGYLSSTQALADYGEVILHVKNTLSAQKCPVIILGASYGGMLAAWFRLKYPHIAMGAIASSAPILYLDDITTQNVSSLIISKNFKDASKTCYTTIKVSWRDIDHVASSQGGLGKLNKFFSPCRPFNNTQDLKDFLIGMYTNLAQYAYLIQPICDRMDKFVGDTLTKLKVGLGNFVNRNCSLERINTGPDINGWDFQSCTEIVRAIGYAEDSMFQPAPFDMNQYTKKCKEKWGVTPRPRWATTYFGGHNISFVLKNFASNIIFYNGLKDPYSYAGVLKSISDSVVALVAKEGGWYSDFVKPYDYDPQWLIKLRNDEIKIIGKWLSEYYASINKSM